MENRHFTSVVAGDNHENLIAPYDSKIKMEPYVVFEFAKAAEYHRQRIEIYENLLKSDKLPEGPERDYIQNELDEFKEMDDTEFYLDITSNYELDEETGNAITSDNPNGKYQHCAVAKNFAMPLILKDGTESFSARKKDVDWSKTHLANTEPYEVAWETVMEHRKPKNDEEKAIYDNMKERTHYFTLFGTKENYVKSCTAFWGYAFLSEKTGWVELGENQDQFEWTRNFYDNFIKPLSDNTLITIYECIKN